MLFVTTLCHSLLFFCDVLLCDVKSHTALVIAYYSFVVYCYVMSSLTRPSAMSRLTMWCSVSHRPSSMSSLTILFVRNTEVLLPNFLWLWGDFQINLALHARDDGCLKDHPYQYQPLSWWQMLVSRIMVGFIEVWYFTKNISPATRWCLPVPDRVPTALQLLLGWSCGHGFLRPAVSHFARLARWGPLDFDKTSWRHARRATPTPPPMDESFTWFACHLPRHHVITNLLASL